MSLASPSTVAPLNSKKRTKELLVQQQDDILIIKINRPQAKNALNRNALYELIAAVEGASNNSHIKIVVLTGEGDIYTAGNDLKQIQDYKQPADYNRGANFVLRALIKTFVACPKILICLVNGPCIGIGFTLAALCDAVYCTKNAYFQTPFSQLGICPEACSSYTFPRHFSLSWSSKLLMFGEKLYAQKAEQLGFVVEVYDDDLEVKEKFWPKIEKYAKLSGESLKVSKKLIRAHYDEDLMRAMYMELKEIEKLRCGPVFEHAVQEFMQKSLNLNKSKL